MMTSGGWLAGWPDEPDFLSHVVEGESEKVMLEEEASIEWFQHESLCVSVWHVIVGLGWCSEEKSFINQCSINKQCVDVSSRDKKHKKRVKEEQARKLSKPYHMWRLVGLLHHLLFFFLNI